MNYLQPRYIRSHDPGYKYNPLKVYLGGKFGEALLVFYEEDLGKKFHIPPHFHVKSETAEICIKFDRAEYFLDGKNKDFLTPEQMTILDTALREKMKPHPSLDQTISYWHLMHRAWNRTGDSMRPSVRSCQPDYTNIHIPTTLKENLR